MSSSWYQPAPFYLLRVPVLPSEIFVTLSQHGQIDLSPEQDLEQAWMHARKTSLQLLEQLATHPLIEQALMVASPSLAEALGKRQGIQDRRKERAYERLLRYVIRMSSRPTPFGCCAGAAFGTFAAQSSVLLEQFEGAGIRPDMHWLLTWLSELEERFLSFLDVQVTPALFVFGNRGMGVKQGKHDKPDERIWFNMTPVFHLLRKYARMPVPYTTLKHLLLTAFPQATGEQVETFLHDLYRAGALLTSLLPADEHDSLSHVIEVLRPVAAASSVITQLEVVQKAMHAASSNIHMLPTAIRQLQALTPEFEGLPVQVDTRVQMKQNELSSTIGQEAAKTVEVLLRLGMYPHGLPSLHHAHRLFLERYEEQEVPLLTLFAPQGALEHLYDEAVDLGELSQAHQSRIAQRARLLRTLAMQAVNARQHSIDLTPELIERLSLWSPSEDIPPPLLDLYMQVDASSLEALDRGDWQGLVTLLPTGGRSYRRFLHLFGEREQQMVREVWHAGEACCPEYLCATLAVLPTRARDLNVMHGPLWSTYVVPINRPSPAPPEQTILPDDLLVSLRAGRFLLRSQAHNKAVRIIQPHMLSFTHLPSLARFLLEASQDGEPFPNPFQWGKAGALPFLPRLTWGKTIVSLAQWTLSQDLLDSEDLKAEGVQWFRALQRWREQWRVPRYVSYVTEGEDRLLLDLEHPLMVEILRQELAGISSTKTALTLQEALFRKNVGWLRDQQGNAYCSEIVIPLIKTAVSPQPSPLRGFPQTIPEMERRFLPGQEWLYLKLYLPEGLHQILLAGPWSAFVQRYRSLFDGWFFVRYQDPQDHIRLRILVRNAQQRGHLLEALLAWCHEIQQAGLLSQSVLDTYERETERYGGPTAIATIERVFCANSEAICALLAGQRGTHPPLFDAVYALDRLWSDWGYDLSARYHALQRDLPSGKESRELRQLRQPLLAYLRHPPEDISNIFDRQALILAQAGTDIRCQASQGTLWRTEEEILWSLSHMLCNRLLGTSRKLEQEAYAAWRAILKVRYHTSSP
jgi:thiopeptide-type bacteriocin biosynthesis protein